MLLVDTWQMKPFVYWCPANPPLFSNASLPPLNLCAYKHQQRFGLSICRSSLFNIIGGFINWTLILFWNDDVLQESCCVDDWALDAVTAIASSSSDKQRYANKITRTVRRSERQKGYWIYHNDFSLKYSFSDNWCIIQRDMPNCNSGNVAVVILQKEKYVLNLHNMLCTRFLSMASHRCQVFTL